VVEPRRGEIWWADLGEGSGSHPAFRRPVVVVQSDSFNRSRIATVVAVPITSNLDLAAAPGNVLVPARSSKLRRDSVVNVSQPLTLDRAELSDRVGPLPLRFLAQVDAGLRVVLDL
jgi:mRNA interferase MazF